MKQRLNDDTYVIDDSKMPSAEEVKRFQQDEGLNRELEIKIEAISRRYGIY